MKKISITLVAALCLASASAWAKLPPPSEEAKAKAEEAKAKADEAAKKSSEDLAKSQDAVAARYIKDQKAKGIVVKPTPVVAPTPAGPTPPTVPQATTANTVSATPKPGPAK